MMFCPKCKSIMMPKVDGGKKQFVCGCGYKHAATNVMMTESSKHKNEGVAVVDEEKSVNVIVDVSCPKCDNARAEYWEIQTRSSDEPPTRFYKCLKCKHTWREYK